MDSIRYENVTKTVGSKKIIDDISFEVKQGEVFGLLGPNGAGKTTLMKMTVGLFGISQGDIKIMDKSVKTQFTRAMKDVGSLIENPALYPYMSEYDNLKIFASMTRVSKKRIQEVVELVGMEKAIKQKVGSYSLGMKQRLGIAIALLRDPKVLILDEPTNGLDPQGITDLRNYLRKLAEEKNISVMVSSHMLTEMALMCDRFAIIKKGCIKRVMTKEESERMQGKGGVQIDVDNAEKAASVLQNLGTTVTGEDRISIKTDREGVAEANKILINNGIKVYSIASEENALERYYFSIINEED